MCGYLEETNRIAYDLVDRSSLAYCPEIIFLFK